MTIHRQRNQEKTRFAICQVVIDPCCRKYVEVERNNLNILASIRPDLVIPPLLRKLDLSLETLTEPFKFTAAVKCLVSG